MYNLGTRLIGFCKPLLPLYTRISRYRYASKSSSLYYDKGNYDTVIGGLLSGMMLLGAGVVLSSTSIAQADRSTQILGRNAIADAAEAAAASVVNIICPVQGMMMSGVSSGSGFIIDGDGFVVTNAHVVGQAADGQVVVTLWDGRKFEGKVHSVDRLSDIALVKINKPTFDEDLPVATLGTSGSLRAGEFVVALGSPLFLQNSVTFGIVSAPARHGSELGMDKNRAEFIQTDASINVGNSGGPLVNLDGEVIGINTMKAQGTDGISFAIPIDLASVIIKQLLKHKRVVRPYIGIKMADFIPDKGMGPRRGGARGPMPGGVLSVDEVSIPLVVEVISGSPAYKGGLRRGDVVLDIDGKAVSSVKEVLDCIGMDVGRTLTFTVRHSNGQVESVRVATAADDVIR